METPKPAEIREFVLKFPARRTGNSKTKQGIGATLTGNQARQENAIYPALREHGLAEKSNELNQEHGPTKFYLFRLPK